MTDSWSVVASFYTEPEAYIAKGVLESHEIPCTMVNDTISSVYPMTATWAPIELKVPDEFLAEARRLLSPE